MKLLKELQDQAVLNEMTDVVKFATRDLEKLKRAVKTDDELSDGMMEKLQNFVTDYDPEWMPYGTQKARDGDPYEWIYNHMDEIISAITKNARLT